MLSSLAKWSKQRSAWLVLALSATVLLGLALYFQYQMNLQPCMLCVYARAALTGVIFGSTGCLDITDQWFITLDSFVHF